MAVTENATARGTLTGTPCQRLPGWEAHVPDGNPRALIGVLPGEGIGPEVITATEAVLAAVAAAEKLELSLLHGGAIGTVAQRDHGHALTPEVTEWCAALFDQGGTLLCGPGGGRFVYDLRARFDLFCQLAPIRPDRALRRAGVLRPEAVEDVDLLVVRENLGGLYFGDWHRDGDAGVVHTSRYTAPQVERILRAAVSLAESRRGRVCMVTKPGGIPGLSALWSETLEGIGLDAKVEARVLEIDNASFQIIAAARELDVVVAPNLFGDILGDTAALLLGSRGMSYSANYGAAGVAVYQTGHGAAHDLAGRDVANPLAQIRTAALLLRERFGLDRAADRIELAIGRTLADGVRTADIAAAGERVVGTREMGEQVAARIEDAHAVAS